MRKNGLFNCLILSGALLLGTSCKERSSMPANNRYKTWVVSTTDKTLRSTYSASIQGKQDVGIYPQVAGLLTQVCIKEGASVKKGQMLFVIDQIPYKAALETAKANVESAEAAVATAQMTADSKQELYKEEVVSEFDLQAALNTLRSQKAALAQARSELVNAQNNLSYTEIKSPVDGTAGMIPFRIGALVSSSITTPLVSVSDNEEMYVYFSMTEKQVLSLSRRNGSLTHALEAMPEVELVLNDGSVYSEKGKVDAISGIIDTKTGSVSVRAVFPNPEQILRSGGAGNVLLPYERKNCIVIPQDATFEIQDKIFVYKVVDGKTKSAMVSVLGINDGKEYIVESGLAVGDIIIAEGAGLLSEGIPVESESTSTGTIE